MALIPPKPSATPSLPWCDANRASLPAYLRCLRGLANLQPVITSGGATRLGAIQWSGSNAQLNLGELAALDPETVVWRDRAIGAGGTFAANSIALADALIRAVKASSFDAKIVYLLPLLGGNLATARVPLRDMLGAGIAGSTGFVDADFSQAHGLQGNGSTKYLDSHLFPGDIGVAGRGGLGFIENNIAFSGTGGDNEPIGCYQTPGAPFHQYIIFLPPTLNGFVWGDSTQPVVHHVASANAHYYGQRSATTFATFYINGVSVGTNTNSVTPVHLFDKTLLIVGSNQVPVDEWGGRCACAYMSNGTLTDAEAAALHTLLQTKLITPTGR